ncbi:MAG: thiamine phosphate synthase [Planctomycetes bacterium]|nr:thiamine phosphate synthase [Planctomycetota bacterium]
MDIDALRIIDANLNRSREALRTIEEYARFVVSNQRIALELKSLRHELTGAFLSADDAARELIAARDSENDVLRDSSDAVSSPRGTTGEIVASAFSRLKESLRVLEEYSKAASGATSREVERLRYKVYDLEKDVTVRGRKLRTLSDARLYAIYTDEIAAHPLETLIEAWLDAGVKLIQLRMKRASDAELFRAAERARRLTENSDALLVVNDRVDVALAVDADGVHVSEYDLPLSAVRKISRGNLIVGYSTHSLADVLRARSGKADYIGAGPAFETSTKQVRELKGPAYLESVAKFDDEFPVFAIGGIDASNVAEVLATGVNRVAVSGALCKADDPGKAARELLALLQDAADNITNNS